MKLLPAVELLLAFVLAVVALVSARPAWKLWSRWRAARQRARAEDALKHLHAAAWRRGTASLDSLAGALRLSPAAALRLVRHMEMLGWVASQAEGLSLTPEGERLAVEVVRAHRLWERYLADEARMPLRDIHAEAERREHDRPEDRLRALEAAMGHPALDPHGDPIPTADGQLPAPLTRPLTDWPPHTPARIAHLEDEPAVVFSQILALGVSPGQVVRIIEAGPQRIVLTDGERIHSLAPVVAANIFVAPDGAEAPAPSQSLASLRRGQQAEVQRLDESLQGFTRRRLLDLGLTPGTVVTAELDSLFGDPMAYRVRGTLVALRRDQAEKIAIAPRLEDQPQ